MGRELKDDEMPTTDQEWEALLGQAAFRVARKGGTEPAFTGKFWDTHDDGIYRCACCGTALFRSDEKFDSGTGWPSYWQPIADGVITEHRDISLMGVRTEIRCGRCDAHLGHVFPDGPKPTGLRYCVNSCSLDLDTENQA